MPTILVADDHPVVRRGLRQILSVTPDMVIAGEAGSGQEVLGKIRKNHYDVVLLDIALPDMSGLEVLKQLKSVRPELNVLVLSIHPEEQYALRVLRAGACGYLTKDIAPEELIIAIRKASLGKKYVSPSLAEKLAADLGAEVGKLPHQTLSDREYQVMCMIASGKAVKEIAAQMFLSPKTISTYRSRILEKMNLKSNVELIHYAIHNQLVD